MTKAHAFGSARAWAGGSRSVVAASGPPSPYAVTVYIGNSPKTSVERSSTDGRA